MLLLLLTLACSKGEDTAAAAAPGGDTDALCPSLRGAQTLWAVTIAPIDDECGLGLGSVEAIYGVEYTGLGFAVRECEGLDADGVVAGCAWTYQQEALSRRGDWLPAGGSWSLEAEGYAWDAPVDYCSLPEGLDWETEEVLTLEDAGTTGLTEDCTITLAVTGVLY
jgi:hypothetical protein